MKSERLLSIMILLANRDQLTAPELAKRFGVTQRTIYRDIEALSTNGVPILTEPGRNGGISLIEDFRIDRNLVKPDELCHIVNALQGLATAVNDSSLQNSLEKYRNLLPKPGHTTAVSAKNLELHMELAPSRRERESIECIRQAASLGRLLAIDYADGSGRLSQRRVEPYAVVFQWASWYLYAWCCLRGGYRVFKLARIRGLALECERFVSRQPDLASRPWTRDWESLPFDEIVLRFHPSARLTVQEHFEAADICFQPDGSAIVTTRMPVDGWVVAFLSGFGADLEVIAPLALRERLRSHAAGILENHEPKSTPN